MLEMKKVWDIANFFEAMAGGEILKEGFFYS